MCPDRSLFEQQLLLFARQRRYDKLSVMLSDMASFEEAGVRTTTRGPWEKLRYVR
jgi:hypothetical protein